MALPTAYLTTVKNVEGILNAIRGAQAPDKFTQRFLESLGFKGNADRLFINLLKSLGFLDDGGRPTKRYFAFLDQTQSARVLADGIRESYADLFKINVNAHKMSRQDLINKLKTLSEGKLSESVASKMALTFQGLVKLADFSGPPVMESTAVEAPTQEEQRVPEVPLRSEALRLGGLVYNIQIVLPESRDEAVYEALFSALRRHLP